MNITELYSHYTSAKGQTGLVPQMNNMMVNGGGSSLSNGNGASLSSDVGKNIGQTGQSSGAGVPNAQQLFVPQEMNMQSKKMSITQGQPRSQSVSAN